MKTATLALLAGLLAGCADYPISPVARGSELTGPIDGFYDGRATLTDAKDGTCPPSARGSLALFDARVVYPYSTNISFAAPVGDDGKLHDQVGQSTIDGTLIHGQLVFDVKTPACQTSFAFRRVPGF